MKTSHRKQWIVKSLASWQAPGTRTKKGFKTGKAQEGYPKPASRKATHARKSREAIPQQFGHTFGMEAQNKLDRLADLLKRDPTNLALRRDCVDIALQLKRFDDALALVDQGLAQAPLDDALRFAKTNALIGRGEYHAAAALLSELHALHPVQPGISQNLALCEYVLGRFAEARALLEGLYASGDRSAGVLRLLISSCHHLSLMDRATELADANQEVVRSDAALAGTCALMFVDVSRVPDAVSLAATALRSIPSNVDALTVNAAVKMSQGEVDEARATFRRILELQPNNGRAWLGLGSIAMIEQDFPAAKHAVTLAVEQMPKHVGSWHMLGWMHWQRGELDEAQTFFEQALELNRNFAETHGALASIAALRGEVDRAQEMVKIAMRLDPECLAARLAQAILSSKSGEQQKAQRLIGDAMRKVAGSEVESFQRLVDRAMKHRKPN